MKAFSASCTFAVFKVNIRATRIIAIMMIEAVAYSVLGVLPAFFLRPLLMGSTDTGCGYLEFIGMALFFLVV